MKTAAGHFSSQPQGSVPSPANKARLHTGGFVLFYSETPKVKTCLQKVDDSCQPTLRFLFGNQRRPFPQNAAVPVCFQHYLGKPRPWQSMRATQWWAVVWGLWQSCPQIQRFLSSGQKTLITIKPPSFSLLPSSLFYSGRDWERRRGKEQGRERRFLNTPSW